MLLTGLGILAETWVKNVVGKEISKCVPGMDVLGG